MDSARKLPTKPDFSSAVNNLILNPTNKRPVVNATTGPNFERNHGKDASTNGQWISMDKSRTRNDTTPSLPPPKCPTTLGKMKLVKSTSDAGGYEVVNEASNSKAHETKVEPSDLTNEIPSSSSALNTNEAETKEGPSSSKGKKFKCEFPGCSKQYREVIKLQEHGNKHTGVRPFVCSNCPMAFQKNSYLEKHKNKCGGMEARSEEETQLLSKSSSSTTTVEEPEPEIPRIAPVPVLETKTSICVVEPGTVALESELPGENVSHVLGTPPIGEPDPKSPAKVGRSSLTRELAALRKDYNERFSPSKIFRTNYSSSKSIGEPRRSPIPTGDKSPVLAGPSRHAFSNSGISSGQGQDVTLKETRDYGFTVQSKRKRKRGKLYYEPNSRFMCTICWKSCSSARNLKYHTFSHPEEVWEFECPLCKRRFYNQHMLRSHVNQSKKIGRCRKAYGQVWKYCTKEGGYKCPDCKAILFNQTGFMDHLNIHSGKRPYKCGNCEECFHSSVRLSRHRARSSNCQIGGKQSTSNASRSELQTSSELEGRQPINNISIPSTSSHLQRILSGPKLVHKSGINNPEQILEALVVPSAIAPGENDTSEDLSSKSAMQVNEESDEVIPPKQKGGIHVCPYCHRQLATVKTLEDHIRTHTGEKPFSCRFCSASYPSDRALFSHRRSWCKVRRSENITMEQVRAEAKQVNNPHSLHANTGNENLEVQNSVVHQPNHPITITSTSKPTLYPRSKPFRCLNCGMRFFTLTEKKQHRLVPCKRNPAIMARLKRRRQEYLCRFCGKELSSMINLENHTRMHTNERPFKCSRFGQGYPSENSLIRHQLSCTGGGDLTSNDKKEEQDAAENWRGFSTIPENLEQNTSSTLTDAEIPLIDLEEETETEIKVEYDMLSFHSNFETEGLEGDRDSFDPLLLNSTTTPVEYGMRLPDKSFPCTQCGKILRSRQTLRNHLLIHSGVKAFKCGNCGHAYSTKLGLKQHVRNNPSCRPTDSVQQRKEETNLPTTSNYTAAVASSSRVESIMTMAPPSTHIIVTTGQTPDKNICRFCLGNMKFIASQPDLSDLLAHIKAEHISM